MRMVQLSYVKEWQQHYGCSSSQCRRSLSNTNRPFAVKYGRRPVYLLSNLLMGVACIWCGIAAEKNYSVFIAGRAFLGIFEAPIESIVPSTVTDIFFLHERGEKVSWYGLSVLGGNELGPMLSAFIIEHLNMRWAFLIVGIFIFAAEVPLFFFMPETRFLGYRPNVNVVDTFEDEKSSAVHVEHDGSMAEVPKQSYIQSLKPWGKNDPSVNIWHAFLRPFVLLAYPTVLWSCAVYGMALSWNVIIGATLAQIYAPP
jgi:MFS family permease